MSTTQAYSTNIYQLVRRIAKWILIVTLSLPGIGYSAQNQLSLATPKDRLTTLLAILKVDPSFMDRRGSHSQHPYQALLQANKMLQDLQSTYPDMDFSHVTSKDVFRQIKAWGPSPIQNLRYDPEKISYVQNHMIRQYEYIHRKLMLLTSPDGTSVNPMLGLNHQEAIPILKQLATIAEGLLSEDQASSHMISFFLSLSVVNTYRRPVPQWFDHHDRVRTPNTLSWPSANEFTEHILAMEPHELNEYIVDTLPHHTIPDIRKHISAQHLESFDRIVSELDETHLQPLNEYFQLQPSNSESDSTEVNLHIEEVPPIIALLRGVYGGDCSMESVLHYVLLPNTKTFFIHREARAAPIGYILLVEAEVNGNTQPIFITANGNAATSAEFRSAALAINQAYGNTNTAYVTKSSLVTNTENAKVGFWSKQIGSRIDSRLIDTPPPGWDYIDEYSTNLYARSRYYNWRDLISQTYAISLSEKEKALNVQIDQEVVSKYLLASRQASQQIQSKEGLFQALVGDDYFIDIAELAVTEPSNIVLSLHGQSEDQKREIDELNQLGLRFERTLLKEIRTILPKPNTPSRGRLSFYGHHHEPNLELQNAMIAHALGHNRVQPEHFELQYQHVPQIEFTNHDGWLNQHIMRERPDDQIPAPAAGFGGRLPEQVSHPDQLNPNEFLATMNENETDPKVSEALSRFFAKPQDPALVLRDHALTALKKISSFELDPFRFLEIIPKTDQAAILSLIHATKRFDVFTEDFVKSNLQSLYDQLLHQVRSMQDSIKTPFKMKKYAELIAAITFIPMNQIKRHFIWSGDYLRGRSAADRPNFIRIVSSLVNNPKIALFTGPLRQANLRRLTISAGTSTPWYNEAIEYVTNNTPWLPEDNDLILKLVQDPEFEPDYQKARQIYEEFPTNNQSIPFDKHSLGEMILPSSKSSSPKLQLKCYSTFIPRK